MRAHWLILGAVLFAAPASASQDGQIWTSFGLSGPVAGDFALYAEAQFRFGDEASRLTQAVFRGGVGYQPSDNLSFYAGYARIISPRVGAPDRKEERIWQQASYPIGAIGRVQLAGRTRIEQRRVLNSDDWGLRLRQQVKATMPVREGSRVRLAASFELLWNANDTDWGVASGLDQTRAFAGVNLPLAEGLSLETGYQNRIQRNAGAPNDMDHIASATLTYRLRR
jgi:uncharacterized protein DUF2490